MTPLLRSVLERAIADRRDCELLRQPTLASNFMIATACPDVVMVGLDTPEDSALVPALFARWPAAHVVTVKAVDDQAVVYTLRPHQRVLVEMSPDGIVETLREAVYRERERPYDQ